MVQPVRMQDATSFTGDTNRCYRKMLFLWDCSEKIQVVLTNHTLTCSPGKQDLRQKWCSLNHSGRPLQIIFGCGIISTASVWHVLSFWLCSLPNNSKHCNSFAQWLFQISFLQLYDLPSQLTQAVSLQRSMVSINMGWWKPLKMHVIYTKS